LRGKLWVLAAEAKHLINKLYACTPSPFVPDMPRNAQFGRRIYFKTRVGLMNRTLTDITTKQNLSHLSAEVLYIKGVGYFLYACFTLCMTHGKMYKFNNFIF
jgi:hypothetical protein